MRENKHTYPKDIRNMPTKGRINNPAVASYSARSVWLLALLAFACHGMLLLNDGVYWDGWVLYGHYLNQDVESLLGTFKDAGNPGTGYFHRAFWWASNPLLAYRLVIFLGILLSTLLVYFIVQRVSALSSLERWFIAAMYCCYSAYQAYVEIIMSAASLTYAIFLLGAFVALRSFETKGRTALVLRLVALACIGFSFRLNSLLVFYFPFLILFLLGRKQEWVVKELRGKLGALSRYGDFILLPFGYWIVSRLLRKRQNEYAEYNHLILDPKQWAIDFWKSIGNAIFAQFHNVQVLAGNRPLLALSLIAMAVLAERVYFKMHRAKVNREQRENAENPGDLSSTFKIAMFAFILLVCALFPYLAVGKFPSVEGWDTRHALLISLPVAGGLVAIGRSLHFVFLPNLVPHILRVSAGLLVVAFTLVTCKVYLEWQVRWIKDSSFILNVQKIPKEQTDKINIFLMNDAYPVGYEFYRFYEYAAMFKMAWGVESKIGFHPSATHDAEWVLKNVPLKRTLLKDFRAGSCQGMITIRAKHPERSRLKLVTTYLKYRWIIPAELPAFLSDVTTLELTDITCPSPVSPAMNQ